MNAETMETRLRAAFGFKFAPFAKNLELDERFESGRLKKAREQLAYLASRRGIGLLASDPGLGKSTLLRGFLGSLSQATHCPVYVPFTNCATLDVFRQIAQGFGLTPPHRKGELMGQIQERLLKLSRAQKLRPVLVIDDAQLLTSRCLDELRLLTSFDMDARDELTLVLAGHPQLESNLRLAINEALAQRIVLRIQLRGLTREELEGYLSYRLTRAGRTDQLFEAEAIEALWVATHGVPRAVDGLAEQTLLLALAAKAKSIKAELVTQAAEERPL
jgi:type II secretory pathway predicted ATPase ExeA